MPSELLTYEQYKKRYATKWPKRRKRRQDPEKVARRMAKHSLKILRDAMKELARRPPDPARPAQKQAPKD